MVSKLISLNVALPKTVTWDGKSVETSMHKSPVSKLKVGPLSVDGDDFANRNHHGTPDAVLYAYGLDALADYSSRLERDDLKPGDLGENLSLDRLDEAEVSVGDIFKIGEVLAQATFPRVPCSKINFRLKTQAGMKAMIAARRSGIYFRILQPGEIVLTDTFERVERAKVPFTIREVYERVVGGVKVTSHDLDRVRQNGAFPMERISKWLSAVSV